MLKSYAIVDNRIVESPNGHAPIQVYSAPDDAERRHLVEDLKIDEHTLASALDPDELARMEFEPDHVAMIYKRPRNYSGKDQLLFRISSAGMFLFKDQLLVVLPEDAPLFDTRQFHRISSLNQVMLRVIHRAILHFLEHLRAINSISDELERKINLAMENRFLINLFSLEKSLVYYLNAIHTNGVLIEKLRNSAARMGLNGEELEALDDTYIENSQCYKLADIYSSILASLMDARVSIVSNNLNVLLKLLNILTLGIMVPTLIVSAFSMNVKLPIPEEGPFAFWFIMSLATISVVGFYFVWKRMRW
ncbi:MAG: magnesium transporter CorA family protein [Candidatus Sumerlaeota bacterium]|nr:magnesium transporter CorA family protein [Candidatus Sumerlaeota bacterium]